MDIAVWPRPRGVRVNAVAPGIVGTDMSNFTKTEAGREVAIGIQALKRIGTAEDVADVVAFLGSDRVRWITGASIPVDGGSKLKKLTSRIQILRTNTMTGTMQAQNKELVLKAFGLLFNQPDDDAAEKFRSPDHVQHSAHIEPGREGLFDLVKSLSSTLRYESGLVVAEGDFVIAHGRSLLRLTTGRVK